MSIKEEHIRLIFGLKMRQLRTRKNLSLYGLAKKSGLSKSYLNEIENGKKYPKQDKILELAQALDTTYDDMVSLKLDKNLAPLGEILESGVLKELPLKLFGIEEHDLINIISNAPSKVNAFISTIIEIAKTYHLDFEGFYLAALRSYQEAENNFFSDLESKAVSFGEAYQLDLDKNIPSADLEEILVEEYGYHIVDNGIEKDPLLDNLRSVFVPKSRKLLLSSAIDEAQRAFIFGKEIAYNYLALRERPYTFSWITYHSFDEVLNNFYASYFSGALLLSRKRLQEKLKTWLHSPSWNETPFTEMLKGFNASPESVYHRLTNILTHDFGIRDLFFLRFVHQKGDAHYTLSKELHITQHQKPSTRNYKEHYCRRWISIKTLQQMQKMPDDHIFGAQVSTYENGNKYLVLSSATPDPFDDTKYRSASLGILITPHLQRKYPLLQALDLPDIPVGITCESCSITDCEVRAIKPRNLLKQQRFEITEQRVQGLISQHS
ncbi:helix-turn-helix domain-containing protein [Robertkochia sediminum]|uniref:helix-turn-helix domain-containing protein n=1 Tax=Robertkochia sediminum TaxID=2785326 RepID=UPI0019345556|nr:helix-turn-helix transcriptional regulator [Robertkochia sediminum]MBL7471176.1 helix-turn-helix domain-containing protein [Robertkochia sediminum]